MECPIWRVGMIEGPFSFSTASWTCIARISSLAVPYVGLSNAESKRPSLFFAIFIRKNKDPPLFYPDSKQIKSRCQFSRLGIRDSHLVDQNKPISEYKENTQGQRHIATHLGQ